jgi:aryl-alcohol dehydrogenase-like predicted oxidoreductase
MKTRSLGSLKVTSIGLGCMGMSWAYGPADEAESLRVLHRYVELGGNFLDTAEIYGPYKNEELVGRFLKETKRESLVIATKFGFKIGPQGPAGTDGSAANCKRAVDGCLQRLGIDVIDLYYQHRVDLEVPIEETVGGMAELVKAGKVRAIGLSEASAQTLRRAAAVHPIAAIQSEYSLWTLDPERNGVLATCRELGIGFVPYSPLGRGFLTGAIKKFSDLDAGDWRRTNYPRFGAEVFEANLRLADAVKALAKQKGCTPAQLALAWLLAQGDHIVPIPGTKRVSYLEDNLGAEKVTLTAEDEEHIREEISRVPVTGDRYQPAMMKMVNA